MRTFEVQISSYSTVCRLCQQRHRHDQSVVCFRSTDRTPNTFSAYCRSCYNQLRTRAAGTVEFPEPTFKPKLVLIPAFWVKEEDPFYAFFPTDPIDLGLLRQRAKEARTVDLTK